jgi:dipeptidyl aminopeptidase/acylaminoacyl peptidase
VIRPAVLVKKGLFMRVLAVVAMVVASLLWPAPARSFGLEDIRRLVSLTQPQISPDGARVVYIRGTADFDADRVDRQLVLIDVQSRKTRQLTYGRKDVSSPRWSPGGDAIAFLASDGDEKNPQDQIFVMPMNGGDARQVTHAKNGVDGFSWSPDGERFAFITEDDDPNQKNVDAHLDAFQVHDNDYLHDSATPPEHAWTIASSGGAATRLTSGDWSVADIDPSGGGDLAWSGDGRTLAIDHLPTPFVGDSLDSRIELIDLASKHRRFLDDGKIEGNVAYAPRGGLIAYTRNTGGQAANGVDLYATTSNGHPVFDLRTRLDRSVDDYAWSRSGDAVWVVTPDGTRRSLFYVPIAGGIDRVPLGDVQPATLGNTAKNGSLVFVASTPAHPAELYILDGPHATPSALTDENGFVAKTGIAKTIGIQWRATKGDFIEDGVLTQPLGYRGGKAPLVLLIHGGPQAASNVAWSSFRQVLAAHGYFVFEPNYRGSTNLGDRYQRAIANDNGDGPGKDAMAGLAKVESIAQIDTSRIGVSGWSYGGFMTSWLIGNYHVWKAAVTGASLDDWLDDFNVAFYVYTDVPYFHGVPWNPANTPEWREQSPLTYAQNATTPTLILGDVGDNNVPITNSYKLYHALKDNGATVQFVAYPVPGHFPSDPVRSLDVYRRWLDWLASYLK